MELRGSICCNNPRRKMMSRTTTTTTSVFMIKSEGGVDGDGPSEPLLSHRDLMWKIRPPPEMPLAQKLYWRFAARLLRLEYRLFRRRDAVPPTVLCPKGGKAVVEAYYRPPPRRARRFWPRRRWTKIGRFGITTESGPPAPPILETISDLCGVGGGGGADGAERSPLILAVRTAAIIYMYVEPEFRGRDVGTLALQVISLIHAAQNCDYTVLVADDKGSGELVRWYERHGYAKAPKLQALFGSPDGRYGVTMIAPTNGTVPDGCQIQWW